MHSEKTIMEREKEIKEPYTPENTPNPPQIIDPNKQNDEPGEKAPLKAEKKSTPDHKSDLKNTKPGDAPDKEKLLGESETEITDETTI
jgi:hypothetical protein